MKVRLAALAAALSVSALIPVMPASTAHAAALTNRELVESWYRDFLGRSYDDSTSDPGRFYWSDRLDAGWSREYVLGSIIRSYEYANLEVSYYYNALLNRAPDPGASYWVTNTAYHDMAFEWVVQNILASDEYRVRWDYANGAGYVRSLYFDILGRSASDGEVAYWTGRLNRVGNLNLVREIWYTDEGVRTRLNDNYEGLLRRGADLDGVNFWFGPERQSDITVQVALASTPEYANGFWA